MYILVGDKDSDGNVMVEGSPDVFIKGKAVCRIGDKDSANNVLVEGTPSVLINGVPIALSNQKDSACNIEFGSGVLN